MIHLAQPRLGFSASPRFLSKSSSSNSSSMATEALPTSLKVLTVELGELGVQHKGEPSQQEWQRVTRELEQALSGTGCAYLTQHGLPDDLVNDALSSGAAFFQLGMEEKMKWVQGKNIWGYLKNDDDRYSSESHDLKESFLFNPNDYNSLNKEPPPFKTAVTPLYDHVRTLTTRLLASISLCLGKPRDYLAKMHMNDVSQCCYRFNYYPGTTKGRDDVTGFGAHTDFTTFTMLLSNETGGLQVRDSAGRWMDVPVMPGTVLLNAGEFLPFYSNKRFKAPLHRVVLPSEEQPGRPPRCTLIIFWSADPDVPMWPPSDDPTSPAPPTVKEYVDRKMQEGRQAGKKY